MVCNCQASPVSSDLDKHYQIFGGKTTSFFRHLV